MKSLLFELRYQLHKRNERLQMFVAWHCPRWLVRWTVVRAFAKASQGPENMDKHPDELGYSDVAKAVDAL